jgi:hypothetical protein
VGVEKGIRMYIDIRFPIGGRNEKNTQGADCQENKIAVNIYG